MTSYPLGPLMAIRERRESAAVKAMAEADRRVAEALAEEERAKGELARWQEYAKLETERRWAAFIGSDTSLRGIDDFKAGLADLERREADFFQKAAEAENQTRERLHQAQMARAALQAARKAKEKLERHRDVWLEEEAREAERAEGLELEEFSRPALEAAE